jgi:CheY-like chemotaxis protein
VATAAAEGAVLERVLAQAPDLILHELRTPHTSDLQLLRRLKSHAATRNIPVILLSSNAGSALRAQALEIGAADFVRRPVSTRELTARIKLWLLGAKPRNRSRPDPAGDEILTTALHEIRNPLNAIIEWVSLLQTGKMTPAETSYAYELLASSAHLQRRVMEDLRDARQIATGALKLQVQWLAGVGPVINPVVDLCRPNAARKGIRIHTFVAHDTGPLMADPQRLQQVLWNLLSNAIKFTRRKGSIAVRCSRQEDAVEIQVSDTGVGISQQSMPHIFDRFRRGTHVGEGLGLGLSIVRGLVALHGGSVTAASGGPGHGATFTVRLPLASSTDGAAPLPPTPKAPTDNTPGRRILLAEDHVDTARAVERLLTGNGHHVQHAGSIAEALLLATANPPDLLICDLNLEDGSGLDLLPRLRRLLATGPALPAIALSGFLDETERQRARTAGFAAQLEKPIDGPLLMTAIQQVSRKAPPRGSQAARAAWR